MQCLEIECNFIAVFDLRRLESNFNKYFNVLMGNLIVLTKTYGLFTLKMFLAHSDLCEQNQPPLLERLPSGTG